MKKVLLIIVFIVLVTGCINKKPIDYKEIADINHIIENKENIESVIVRKTTIGSNDCYNVNISKAYKAINNLKIIKESNISVTDNYMSYIFYFNNSTKTTISFEGPYLVEKNKSYVIDFNNVELLEKDLVECKY